MVLDPSPPPLLLPRAALSTLSLGLARKNVLGDERWGAGVETQKNVRGEIGGWGRVPFNETYAP